MFKLILYFGLPVYSQFVLEQCPECSIGCGPETNPSSFSTAGLSNINTGYYVFHCDARISIETQKIPPSLFTANVIKDLSGGNLNKTSTRDKTLNDCVQG